jgi:hypothetical protein
MKNQDHYHPAPVDTSQVVLPDNLLWLRENLAENAHENWAAKRMAEGWTYGTSRDDVKKHHPCLVPYNELPESEKEYDRVIAMETLKTILALGFRIVGP